MSVHRDKLEQAVALLREKDLDCWMMLDRESGTMGQSDPSLDLWLPTTIIGLTVFMITKEGEAYAVVANYDVENLASTGLFTKVVGYELDIRQQLLPLLQELEPARIGLNYSTDDFTADGLKYGLRLKLEELLSGTPYLERLTTAEDVVSALRGRKVAREVDLLKAACQTTAQIWDALTDYLRPGITEMDAMKFIHQKCDELGVQTGWDRRWCPGITAGPESVAGHNAPSATLKLQEGTLFSIDFGVKQDGYVSDLQRTWYLPSASQPQPPAEARQAGEVVRRAIRAAKDAMRPGMHGYEIDAIARSILVEAGYPEYKSALGHQVGQGAHDGGVVLGPRDWPRYAKISAGMLEVGNVFTLEPGAKTSIGRYGAEEMVVVTEQGAEWLIAPQEEIWLANPHR